VDVHMGVDGSNMDCVDCHSAENHRMKGRYYGVSSSAEGRLSCEECHTGLPHSNSILNEHSIKVACQTCHIPVYAKVNPTKMYWDWSTATRKKDGKGYEITDSAGNILYVSMKGDFLWEKDVTPEYVWFNGTADHHLLSDKIDPKQGILKINTLNGSYRDPNSKIIPVKVHRGRQPYDTKNLTIIQAKLWDKKAGKGALWVDLDWQSSLQAGMTYVNLPYSGEYDFIPTEMYLPVNHMVSPANEAVGCTECHTREGGRLAAMNDFYMPGRDRNEDLDMLGRWMLILSFAGVSVHSLIRIVAASRRKHAHTKHA
jgi:octaheme c-type cytochrome (tetrathionate reductase family)